jgi:hypothetical protein
MKARFHGASMDRSKKGAQRIGKHTRPVAAMGFCIAEIARHLECQHLTPVPTRRDRTIHSPRCCGIIRDKNKSTMQLGSFNAL